MCKKNLMYLETVNSAGSIMKKIIAALPVICALMIPFEQMVFAGDFSLALKKTSDVNSVSQININKANVDQHNISQSNADQNSRNQNSPDPHDSSVILPVPMDGSQAGLVSNAGNFHGPWNASVNPRTGNVAFSLTVGSILYDGGQAKRDLVLAYSGGPSVKGVDTFGLGPHWGFNVGTEHVSAAEVEGHKTTDIATGDGHRFTMISDRNHQGKTDWRPLHHKLNDVVFTGARGYWNISKATEAREHIVNGYALREQSRDGRKLYFYYDRSGADDNTRRLTYLCGHPLTIQEQQGARNACINDGLWITYRGDAVIVHGQQDIILHRGENGGIGNIKTITMPSLSSEGISNGREQSIIHFSYDDQGGRPWLLSQVRYPTGQSKTFLYNEQSSHPGAQTSGLPIGIHGAHLPVVTEVITSSAGTGSSIPSVLREWYHYGTLNRHGQSHNYMGYQGEGSIVPGRDNLFDRPDDYTYSVSRDNGLTTTTTTYNKYHLPQLVEQRDNRQNNLLAQHVQEYIPLKGTTFAELPGNYSLPVGSGKTLYATTEAGQDKTITPARVMEAAHYDNKGQTLWKQDAYGRITMTQYCPPEGNARCPAMDRRWPQMGKPEKILMLPALRSPTGSLPFLMHSTTEHRDPEPAVMTVFDYITLPVDTEPAKTTALINTGVHEHVWQVKAKTVGTLTLAAVADLKPGDTLPELSQSRLSTRTTYRYNTELHTATYGQLNQLRVVKYKSAVPVVNGSALVLAAVPHATTIQDEVTVNVHHDISRSAQTRTTTMTIASKPANKPDLALLQGIENFRAEGGELSLGTTVYSLSTGDKIASHDTLKEMQTRWQYDNWHRPVKKTVTPATGGSEQTTKFEYIFTAQENAVVKTLPGGQQFKKVFNALNQVVSTWHRFSDQVQQKSVEGITGWIPDTHTTYTDTGKRASSTVYHADDPGKDGSRGGTIGLTTTFGYDTLNREVWKKTPDGIVAVTIRNDPAMQLLNYRVSTATKEEMGALLTVTESNILGKPVARYQLPLMPEVKKHNRPLYSPVLQHQLQKLLDKRQPAFMLQRHNTYGLLPLSGTEGLLAFVKAALMARAWLTSTTWEYDGNGRRIKQVQGNGAVTRWVYQQGNLVATIAPDGRIIHDTFNVHGKKVSRCIQPVGSTVCHVLGTRGFDAQGNMLWQADEYGQRLHYTWDDNGRMLSMRTPATDEAPAGHTFTYEYNALGMTKASVDSRPYVTHRYDPDTWQMTDTSDAISHLHYTYDKNTGAIIKITRSAPRKENGIIPLDGIDYPGSVQILIQDRYMRPVSMIDEAGNKYTSVHDKLGRVLKTEVQLNVADKQKTTVSPVTAILAVTTYDNFSRPSTITNGQGIRRLFNYDTTGKLASTTDTLQGKVLLKLSYTYDEDTGNILILTREEGNLAAVQRYTYDLQNNLTSFQCRAINTKMDNSRMSETSLDLCPRDIDIKGSGLTRPPVITDQKYSFDQWNNIRQVIETVATDKGAMTKTMEYNYAVKGGVEQPAAYNPNRLLSYRIRWQGRAYSTIPATLMYDSSGRIIKDVDGNILHYNAFGQQDRFINAATGETTTYTYDSRGHQIAKQSFSARNRPLQSPLYMLYSGNTIAVKAQRDKNNQLHMSAELLGIAHSEDGAITRWYLHNYKGDVLQNYSNQSKLLSNNVYSPYGMRYDRQTSQLAVLPAPLKHQSPWWQSHLPGFDGEVTDEATGYQFLGGGYRAYNPVYRQFMAKDSFSPFKKVNGYGFGGNNPVMNTDPTGHSPQWLGYAMGAIGMGMSIVMGLLLPVAGYALGTASGIAVGGLALGMGGAVTGMASGSLQIAATKHPQNMTLQKVSNGFGIAEGVAAIGMGGMGFINGIAGAANAAGGIARITASLLITSSVTGTIAGATASAVSGIDEVMAFNSGIAGKSGLQSAVQYLGYISMGLMAISIASGIGAEIGAEIGGRAGKEGVSEAETTDTTETERGQNSAGAKEKVIEEQIQVQRYRGLPEVLEQEESSGSGQWQDDRGRSFLLVRENKDADLVLLKDRIRTIESGVDKDYGWKGYSVKQEIKKLYGSWQIDDSERSSIDGLIDDRAFPAEDESSFNECNGLLALVHCHMAEKISSFLLGK